MAVTALRYVPLPDEITRDPEAADYPDGALTNRALEQRIAALEGTVADDRRRFRGIRCLEGTVAQSPEARACMDAAGLPTKESTP